MMKDLTYPRRGLHGELVHAVGLQIVKGELQPGDPLPTDLDSDSERGVSRTVVREAIKVLAAKGLVVSRPKTGTHVRERRFWNLMDPDVLAWRLEADPTDTFFVDVFELRRLIEPAAARLAAERATAEEVAALEADFAEM
ncbi:MAG: FadR family transcriptional regulator, partial [Deltaproteobacteria bacterium]